MFLLSPAIFAWDLAILLLLSVSLCVTIASFYLLKTYRNIFARTVVGVLGFISLVGFSLVAYGSFIEPRIIVTTRYTVPLPVQQPLKIVILSDFHVSPYKGEEFVQKVVRKTNDLLPDLVLLAGDYIYTTDSEVSNLMPLTELRASLGVYGVLGNHDQGRYRSPFGMDVVSTDRSNEITSAFEDRGIELLRNENVIVEAGLEKIALAGIDDMWTGQHNLSGALSGIPGDITTILLSHNPSIVLDTLEEDADLIVSGHTHGGQLRLPGFGPLSELPTELGPQFDQGVFQLDPSTFLAITRGLGESGPRARLFAWPEILLLEIEPSGR